MSAIEKIPTATHWGNYLAEVEDGRLLALHPYSRDTDPSPIGQSLVSAIYGNCRIDKPAVRKSYLRDRWKSDTSRRGSEPFVEVTWDDALDLASEALDHVKTRFGNQAIYAGSYGWASAGRFHHAQSQIHRFMNTFGGYTSSRDTYSTAAGQVILRHVLGTGTRWVVNSYGWKTIAEHTDLVVSFGGLPLKNAQVNAGQVGRHTAKEGLARCLDAGVKFVVLSPSLRDTPDPLHTEWIPLRPGSDTALMLGMAHTIVYENKHDLKFLDRYCHGFTRFRSYLTGQSDGQPKDADWASHISEVPADVIRALALRMAEHRTLITASWSVQRAEHGEQPYWMAVTLAAILGQIGLPGCGVGFGLCAVNGVGQVGAFDWPSLEQGRNPVESFIPVSRISDLLLKPGQEIDYDGHKLQFPDIRLIYWAGGNPFHHHQDINRLILAWQKPETVIVNEPWWTASARFADIVFPTTTSLEREDFACSPMDSCMTPMRQVIAPLGERRSDFDIFSQLASRLEVHKEFTEDKSASDWVRTLYARCREIAAAKGVSLPEFDEFWQGGPIEIPSPVLADASDPLEAFRADPESFPLGTPSGRIEIGSETIEGFGYLDCPGHAAWVEPTEWLGSAVAQSYPLHLISNQPSVRLHSQLDNGITSLNEKRSNREPILINSIDAGKRGIETGMIVRVYNSRGECLAGAVVSDEIRAGVVQMATGAWYDPLSYGQIGSLECHGNPNVLTQDRGSSRLAQGPSAQSALVEIECFLETPPPIRAFDPPPFEDLSE